MVVNCAITSWKHTGAPKGDFTPSLGDELVPAPNRPLLGSLIAPGSHAVQSATERGIQLDRMLQVMPAMLVRFGVVPAIGDRLTVKYFKPGGHEITRFEISDEKPDASFGLLGSAGVTTLLLKRVEDGV